MIKSWLIIIACLSGIYFSESMATENQQPTESEWTKPTGDYANNRYSHLDQIDTNNVSELKLAWTFSTDIQNNHEGNPLVIGNTMYLHSPFPNFVYALDLDRNGALKWQYEPYMDHSAIKTLCCNLANRGLAYADHTIYLYQGDTSLVAIEASTGREKWKVINGNVSKGESATNAPIVIRDKVIVGISGGFNGTRGHLSAYSTKDGRLVWRAYSMGTDKDILFDPEFTLSLGAPVGRNSSIETWEKGNWKSGGGAPWGWFAYDPDVNLLYYGTGNSNHGENTKDLRPEQKWASSVIARNPDTGVAKWAYQMTPFNEWRYSGINEMILADLGIAGEQRQVLVHFDQNGFGYTLDRLTGELLSADKFFSATNWATSINLDIDEADYGKPNIAITKAMFSTGYKQAPDVICPSIPGAKNKSPASYSKKTQLFYIPITNMCMKYLPKKPNQAKSDSPSAVRMYPIKTQIASGNHKGALQAWNAVEGETVWTKFEHSPVWSGILTTAGGIVCYGTLDGYLKCLDQLNGEELFSFQAPSGIVGNVMSYMHKGKQYIAVMTGIGGWSKMIDLKINFEMKDQSKLRGTVIVLTLPEPESERIH